MKKVVAIGDLHCGHIAGLTPNGWFKNKTHELTWSVYKSIVKNIGSPDVLIVNGDMIDGTGERSGGTEQITTDRLEQCNMAVRCIKLWNAKEIFLTYGTAYHTGSGEDFEAIVADKLNADIQSHVFIKIEDVMFDVKHHIGGGESTASLSRAVRANRKWNGDNGNQPLADVVLRSHVHNFKYEGSKNHLSMTLPALQVANTKFGARKCDFPVHWGVVEFAVNKNIASFQPHIVDVINKTAKVYEVK